MRKFNHEPSIAIPSTYSIVARDSENGDLGIIVQSKFPAVGSLVPWARAGVGAVATQAWVKRKISKRNIEGTSTKR